MRMKKNLFLPFLFSLGFASSCIRGEHSVKIIGSYPNKNVNICYLDSSAAYLTLNQTGLFGIKDSQIKCLTDLSDETVPDFLGSCDGINVFILRYIGGYYGPRTREKLLFSDPSNLSSVRTIENFIQSPENWDDAVVDENKVILEVKREGQWDLYLIDPKNNVVENLTNTSGVDELLSGVSGDLVIGYDIDNRRLFAVDLSTKKRTDLCNVDNVDEVFFSKDGNIVAVQGETVRGGFTGLEDIIVFNRGKNKVYKIGVDFGINDPLFLREVYGEKFLSFEIGRWKVDLGVFDAENGNFYKTDLTDESLEYILGHLDNGSVICEIEDKTGHSRLAIFALPDNTSSMSLQRIDINYFEYDFRAAIKNVAIFYSVDDDRLVFFNGSDKNFYSPQLGQKEEFLAQLRNGKFLIRADDKVYLCDVDQFLNNPSNPDNYAKKIAEGLGDIFDENIKYSEKGRLYFTSGNVLYIYDQNTDQLESFVFDEENDVYPVAEVKGGLPNGEFCIVASESAVYLINRAEGTCTRIFKGNLLTRNNSFRIFTQGQLIGFEYKDKNGFERVVIYNIEDGNRNEYGGFDKGIRRVEN